MEDSSLAHNVRRGVAICFCLMIAILVAFNTRLITPDIHLFLNGGISFEQMTDNISDDYLQNEFRGKFRLLDLNGFFARVTGRRAYNGVTLLNNGMLGGRISIFSTNNKL